MPQNDCFTMDNSPGDVEQLAGRLHGKYSIKRLMTLHTYYIEKESLLRSIGMYVLTPLPALLSTVLVERTPLQPPSKASTTNWGFWVWLWALIFVMRFDIGTQLKIMIPDMQLIKRKNAAFAIETVSAHTLLMVVVGEVAKFPTPMFAVLMGYQRQ